MHRNLLAAIGSFAHLRRTSSSRSALRHSGLAMTPSPPAIYCDRAVLIFGHDSIRRAAALAILLCGAFPTDRAAAQARYDDHQIDDRFRISIGGYSTQDTNTTLRVDSSSLGLGTLIDLEDNLSVESSVSVARLDGSYRFNRAHRLEWSYYSQTRRGDATIVDEPLEIGGVIFPIDYRIASEWQFDVVKISYAWSFVNTSKYELYVGAGLNIRDLSMTFRGESDVNGTVDVREFDDDETLPLPTLAAGMRYQINDRLMVRYRLESFSIALGGSSGRWQDNSLLLDYDITDHFGIGGGLNFFNIDLKAELDDDLIAETESSHVALSLYLTARF